MHGSLRTLRPSRTGSGGGRPRLWCPALHGSPARRGPPFPESQPAPLHPRPYPGQLQRQALLLTGENDAQSRPLSCPRGRDLSRAGDGDSVPLTLERGSPGRRAGIPELAPERACGRGGEGRGGSFRLLGGRVAAASQKRSPQPAGTSSSSAPAGCPSRAPRPGGPPGPRAVTRSGSGGQRNTGPQPPVIFESPCQKPGARKKRETKGRWGGSPHTPSHPRARPGPYS